MLLQPTELVGAEGRAVFFERVRLFMSGSWVELLVVPRRAPAPQGQARSAEAVARIRVEQAEAKIRLREISRARVQLTSKGLAPGTPATLKELTDPALRPQVMAEPIPQDLRDYRPHRPILLSPDVLLAALRSAGRGASGQRPSPRSDSGRSRRRRRRRGRRRRRSRP